MSLRHSKNRENNANGVPFLFYPDISIGYQDIRIQSVHNTLDNA